MIEPVAELLYMSTCMIFVFMYESTVVIFYKPTDLKVRYPVSSSIPLWFINLRQSLSLYVKLGLWSINPTETPPIVLVCKRPKPRFLHWCWDMNSKPCFLPTKPLYSMNHFPRLLDRVLNKIVIYSSLLEYGGIGKKAWHWSRQKGKTKLMIFGTI